MKVSLTKFARRAHLYLGLVLMPWFIMYGITSLAFNHSDWFGKSTASWTTVETWPFSANVDLSKPFPQELGQEMLDTAGMSVDAWGVYRWGREPTVYVGMPSFWQHRRLAYPPDGDTMRFETREKTFGEFLTGMHARGGYHHDSLVNDLWAFVVDIVCLSFIVWVISGLYLWWRFSRMRLLGGIALAAGFLSFAAFMILL